MILKYTVFVFREPSARAALFVAIQGECRRRAGGCTHRKAGVGQGAKRMMNRGDKKNTDRAT